MNDTEKLAAIKAILNNEGTPPAPAAPTRPMQLPKGVLGHGEARPPLGSPIDGPALEDYAAAGYKEEGNAALVGADLLAAHAAADALWAMNDADYQRSRFKRTDPKVAILGILTGRITPGAFGGNITVDLENLGWDAFVADINSKRTGLGPSGR
jgi:hypothetical protein